MAPHATITASARIAASPQRVYAIIADYRDGHPRILPKEFSGLTVEQGGVGAGTIIRFQMNVFGMTQKFRGMVTEPEPGRVLVETYLEGNGGVTTFTVDPDTNVGGSEVTISTELPVKAGLFGAIERAISVSYLRSIYVRELALLKSCAESQA